MLIEISIKDIVRFKCHEKIGCKVGFYSGNEIHQMTKKKRRGNSIKRPSQQFYIKDLANFIQEERYYFLSQNG